MWEVFLALLTSPVPLVVGPGLAGLVWATYYEHTLHLPAPARRRPPTHVVPYDWQREGL